jgi:hypothetical protein
MASCAVDFCNPAGHHAPMKSDPRISIKVYHRNKNLKNKLFMFLSQEKPGIGRGTLLQQGPVGDKMGDRI